jgi:putative ABC transport system permease protein
MSRLTRWLLRWGLGDADAEVFLSEMREFYHHKVETGSKAAADRWIRREALRGGIHAVATRLRGTPIPRRKGKRSIRAVFSKTERLGSVLKDVRFGLRALRRRPLFTALAVGTLGLGIGASTIVFSLVDGVLLEEMPYARPEELVSIWKMFPEWQGHEVQRDHWDKIGITWPEFLTLREDSQLFREISVRKNRTMVLSGSGMAERLEVGEAGSALFSMLGVRPLLGRVFLPGEEGPGAARLAVLSHSFWSSRLGSDPHIVGTTVLLDESAFEVIGVLPAGFRLRSPNFNLRNASLDTGARALWIPIGFDGLEDGWSLEAMGRLAAGATVDQAHAEVDALLRGGRTADELDFRLAHPKEEIVGGHRSSLLLLLAAASILLVIACVNIASLLMSAAVERRHEMATRMALGAGRFRIAQQVLTESILIGVLGSLFGLALATLGIPGFLALAPPLPRLEEVGMNQGVLLFSILAGVGTGCLFGLVPAFLPEESALSSSQGKGGRSIAGGRGTFRRGLLAAELTLTVVLLVTGGLFARSLVNLTQVDPGFETGSVATVQLHLPSTALQDPDGIRALFMQVLEGIEAIPGVVQAGGVDGLPFPGRASGTGIQIEGRSGGENMGISTENHLLLPGYLETMGIPLLAGRYLTEADERADGPRGMLINEQMARQYWPNESPLGARILQSRRVYEIVGVVGNVRERHLSEAPKPMVYRVGPLYAENMSFVARTEGAPEELLHEMRQAIWAVDPELPLSQETTMAALIEISTGAEGYRTMLIIVFGSLATLLASVGVFGITAHCVSLRTREMGIRMALGAQSKSLVRGVVFETMLPGVVGIGAGLLGAMAVSRLLTGFLFGIEAWDSPTYCGVVFLLGSLSVGAAALPAVRAGRVDPSRVLREE